MHEFASLCVAASLQTEMNSDADVGDIFLKELTVGRWTLVQLEHALEELGCFSLVLECIPAPLGARITRELTIPTIGIGAGPCTDGQVLVLQDLWGVAGDHAPRFVRRYIDGETMLTDALDRYDADVKGGQFPSASESYS